MAKPGVIFEPQGRTGGGLSSRADVALIVGFVPRRAGAPLPAELRGGLEAAGWAGAAPFARSDADVEALLDVPIPVESWSAFDALFDGEGRVVEPGDGRRAPCPMAMAVRSFFQQGGARAWVVRVGDPPPVADRALSDEDFRAARLAMLSVAPADEAPGVRVPLLPGFLARGASPSPRDPATWRGVAHAWGVEEAAALLLPDLPDLCAPAPAPAPAGAPPTPPPEAFRPCGPLAGAAEEAPPALELSAPRLDAQGWSLWALALEHALGLMDPPGGTHHRRDMTLIASLPRPLPGAGDAGDPFALAAGAEPVAGDGAALAHRLGDRRLQLAYPWLGTEGARAAPEGLEGAEGAWAGIVARASLVDGANRSAAGRPVQGLLRLAPELTSGELARARPEGAAGGGSDWAGARISLIGRGPRGFESLSDATMAADRSLRAGGVSRLIGLILRAARSLGRDAVFEASGEALWAELQGEVETLMERLFALGAFAGAGPAEAFDVRVDRRTMTQSDIDAGRLVAEVDFVAAQPVAQVRVSLDLGRAREARV